MAKKRIILEVDEAVHSRLKAEAAQQGAHLGPYCASILEGKPRTSEVSPSVEFDVAEVATMALDDLRELSVSLSSSKPTDWKRKVATVNTEIRRRYRI